MPINLENFEYIKTRGEELYKSFEPAKCPYFNELVYFNVAGLKHLKYKRDGIDRLPQDQYMRFKLLYLVPEVIKLSRTVQGMSSRKGFERIRGNNIREWTVVDRTYFEFIAILDNVRVRVIVKQIHGGQLNFWSIIPYWGGGAQGHRTHHFGNPEED